jgi:hypothetical protein
VTSLRGSSPPVPARRVRADALARADKAWRARVVGASWQEAADLAGFSDPDNCARAVRRAYGKLPRVEWQELRDLWRDRLEVMWRQAQTDMTEQRPGAVTAAVRVATAAAALDGLNEPSRLDVAVSESFELVVAELVAHDLA